MYSDVDVDVKNGAQLLDRLIKEIVTESDAFNVDEFIPLLQRKLKTRNPYIRQLLARADILEHTAMAEAAFRNAAYVFENKQLNRR